MAQDPKAFAQLLQQWMWEQNRPPHAGPPMNAARLAELIGVRRQTVYKWLNGVRPDIETLIAVSEKTGIPLKRLMEAAGYDTPPDPGGVFDFLLEQVTEDKGISDEERGKLTRYIQDLRETYIHGGTRDPQSLLAAC